MKHVNIPSWGQLLLPNTGCKLQRAKELASSAGNTSGSVEVCTECLYMLQ